MTSILEILFTAHDRVSAFLAKHFFLIKKLILIVAHLSLFGFLFPEMRKDFGSYAIVVLLVLLFLSPVSKLLRARLLLQLMGLRRELGILMAYLATVHGVGYLIDPDWFSFLTTPYLMGDFFSISPRYLFGFGAYALTLPLVLTSNNLAQRSLGGKNWKRLHTLVYPLLVLALFHKFLRPNGASVQDLLMPAFILLSYVVLKILAWKNIFSPLAKVIAWGAARYHDYTDKKKESDGYLE